MWKAVTLSKVQKDVYQQHNFESEDDGLRFLSKVLSLGSEDCLLMKSPLTRLKAVFFDMDDTLLDGESLVHLAAALGKKDEVEEVTNQAMAGNLDFKASIEQRLNIFKGFSLDYFREIADGFRLHEGAESLLDCLSTLGIKFYLVSGGFAEWIPKALREKPFSGVCINRLDLDDAGFIQGKGFLEPLIDGRAKAEFVALQLKENNWMPDEIMVVGDGANDLAMMKLCATPVGFRAKKILYPHIRGNILSNYEFLKQCIIANRK